MQTSNTDLIYKALALQFSKANDEEKNAGYSGAMHDGGAGRMREQAKAYSDGMRGIIPPWLKENMLTIQKESDPEYADFLRLQKKFQS